MKIKLTKEVTFRDMNGTVLRPQENEPTLRYEKQKTR